MRFMRMLFVVFVLSTFALYTGAQEGTLSGGRLRLAHYVVDAPEVDILLDGVLVETLTYQAAGQHQPVSDGIHTLTVVPAGADEGAAVIVPFDVTFEADHDYTVALIGQVADASAQPLILDETAIVADVRDLNVPASYAILVHGISDGPTVDFSLDGETRIAGLSFGQFGVVPVTLEPHDILVTFSDDPDQVLFQNGGETPPSDDLLLLTVMAGAYPDNLDVTGAVSRLPDRSALDFLAAYSDESGNTFSTLLAAVEATGLADTLAQEGAYTLFAPTDAAFAALPQETRDLLFAYPDALKAVLLGHIAPSIFTTRDLTGELALDTLGGTQITVAAGESGLTVNGSASLLFGGFPVVTNGNVIGIDRVLIPAN